MNHILHPETPCNVVLDLQSTRTEPAWNWRKNKKVNLKKKNKFSSNLKILLCEVWKVICWKGDERLYRWVFGLNKIGETELFYWCMVLLDCTYRFNFPINSICNTFDYAPTACSFVTVTYTVDSHITIYETWKVEVNNLRFSNSEVHEFCYYE